MRHMVALLVPLLYLSLLTAQTGTAKTNGCNNYDSQHVCNQGQITTDADEAKTILAGGRFTADGSGPPIYVFMSQNCPFSKAFFKDRARFTGVQFRYYPFIATIDNQNQSVQVLMSRSLPEFSSYMDKTLRVPAQPDPARDQALKDLVTARNRLEQIMAENGLYRITTPSWFFIGSEGSLWWTRGYAYPDPVDKIIAYLKPSSAGAPRTAAAPANSSPAPQGGLRVLYGFNANDGSTPEQDLTFDTQGNLYGTTTSGGDGNNLGTVFKLTPNSNGTWSETVLRSFAANGEDGNQPRGGVIFDKAGNLYGTTIMGGSHSAGTIFEMTPGPNGTWTETILHSFSQNGDGNAPWGDLVMDKAGDIYGTTRAGGKFRPGRASVGNGTVFELTRASNGAWSYSVVYNFGLNDAPGTGYGVSAGLAIDAAGNLYGTTIDSASSGDGVAFKLTRGPNGTWTETILHQFHNPNLKDAQGRLLWPPDGYGVKPALIIDTAGNLYGVANNGGICTAYGVGNLTTGNTDCFGMVFKLAPSSNGTWSETILYTFHGYDGRRGGSVDGAGPAGRLVIDAAGNLYGTTQVGGSGTGGTVFKLTPSANGAWKETVLHNFPMFGASGGKEGISPQAGLTFDAAGNLYGTTSQGGPTGHLGTVFELLATSR
jgi:uncharacterized repeat protein (TIGR03803 family)